MTTRQLILQLGLLKQDLCVSRDVEFNCLYIIDTSNGQVNYLARIDELGTDSFKIREEINYDFYLLVKEYSNTPIGER